MRHAYLFAGFLAASLSVLGAAPAAQAGTLPCPTCLRIRVGVPCVLRGRSSQVPDNRFTEIRLPGGRFRGFTANVTTYAIDGDSPLDMAGPARPVLGPAPRGQDGESGEWINHVDRVGGALLAWVHDETGDRPGMGQKTMSIDESTDNGQSWRRLGHIVTGRDSLTQGRITGEGDCSAVGGGDGYYYAYCWRPHDSATIVARAPANSPGPGHWMKWFDGAWSQPGVGGDATRLNVNAAALGRWAATNQLVGIGKLGDDIGLYLSADRVNFTPVPEPLLPENQGSWKRPDSKEFFSYFALMDAATASDQLSGRWLLSYLYIQPDEGFGKRYLVMRPVDAVVTPAPQSPVVGVALARYVGSEGGTWSTIAAVPPSTGYRLEGQKGFLMTAAVPGKPTVELEDCVQGEGESARHLIAPKGACATRGFRNLRRQGFVFRDREPDTQPLYQCAAAAGAAFAANRADCEGRGRMVALLGYDLAR